LRACESRVLRRIFVPSTDEVGRGCTTSLEGEVKPAVPCREILRNVKDPYSVTEILVGKIHGHFSPSFSGSATRCLLVTAREL
jgi:hypothetical protein